MDRAQKQNEIEFFGSHLNSSTVALCADYRGLTVAQMTNIRREFSKLGVSCKVVRNTLAKIAAKEVLKDADSAEVEKFSDMFKGPSFIMFVPDDCVGSAKITEKFAKDLEKFVVKGAWFEGKFLDRAGITALASMASKEETLAKLLNLMNTPATQLVRLLNAPAQQLVQVVSAYEDKLKAA
jgi:large subunit ribosomal protein L10